MKVSKTKLNEAMKKMMAQSDCRSYKITADGSIEISTVGRTYLCNDFLLLHERDYFLGEGFSRCTSAEPPESGVLVALMTPRKALILNHQGEAERVSRKHTASEDSLFTMLLVLPNALEMAYVNGESDAVLHHLLLPKTPETLAFLKAVIITTIVTTVPEKVDQLKSFFGIGGAHNGKTVGLV